MYAEQLTHYERADPPDEGPSDYQAPDGLFVLLLVDGQAVGYGGYRQHDATTGEIKRMYVRPPYRGRGYGRRILQRLEGHGRARGANALILETGVRNDAAISLYHSAGYTAVPTYVSNRDRRINRAFAKALLPQVELSQPTYARAVTPPQLREPCVETPRR